MRLLGWLLAFADLILVAFIALRPGRLDPGLALALHAGLLAGLLALWPLRRAAPAAGPPRPAVDPAPSAGTGPAVPSPERTDDPVPPPAAPARSGRVRDGGPRILLIEDEPDLRALMGRILEDEGYVVEFAEDATQARAQLADGWLPHVVVSDLHLPGEDGARLAAEIRRRWPSLPLLLCSGYPDRLEGLRQQKLTGVYTLAKPFEPEELCRKLREILSDREGNASA